MTNLTNSHSLTDFQRNARTFIEELNENKDPLLLTVNGRVQAVLVDPDTFQAMEADIERQRFIAAIHEAEVAIQQGRTRPAEDVYADMKAKYGL